MHLERKSSRIRTTGSGILYLVAEACHSSPVFPGKVMVSAETVGSDKEGPVKMSK